MLVYRLLSNEWNMKSYFILVYRSFSTLVPLSLIWFGVTHCFWYHWMFSIYFPWFQQSGSIWCTFLCWQRRGRARRKAIQYPVVFRNKIYILYFAFKLFFSLFMSITILFSQYRINRTTTRFNQRGEKTLNGVTMAFIYSSEFQFGEKRN